MSEAVKVLITITRPEGYEDVHPVLVVGDFLSNPSGFTFQTEVQTGEDSNG